MTRSIGWGIDLDDDEKRKFLGKRCRSTSLCSKPKHAANDFCFWVHPPIPTFLFCLPQWKQWRLRARELLNLFLFQIQLSSPTLGFFFVDVVILQLVFLFVCVDSTSQPNICFLRFWRGWKSPPLVSCGSYCNECQVSTKSYWRWFRILIFVVCLCGWVIKSKDEI